ncbi:hypothetical protein [Octadecabacter arcticus]|jgi:hypothetical protein|uniref:hypothetical protein n=1 Tax=Octadecabacter arcticus TaxID=53946 RepID=UPI0002DEDBD5|nr:hypothetical protein [Octadecabacter arcticus]
MQKTTHLSALRIAVLGTALALLAACASQEVIDDAPAVEIVEGYGFLEDGEYTLPPIPAEYLQGVNQRTVVG